ncbi:MAG TPA: hypothetical protein VND40_01550 [Nitrososphaerales archaeon]|nr:hypothetical protein [Nitrososphaerales archaeon]
MGTGSGAITYTLWSSNNGGAYSNTGAACNPSGNSLTCTYTAAAGTYTYEVNATDMSPTTTTSPPSLSVIISKFQSSLSLVCSQSTLPNPPNPPAACTATVTGYFATGQISFQNAGGTATITVPPSCALVAPTQTTSSCSITITATGAGSATIQATYPLGDSNNNPPSSPKDATLVVAPATTTVNVNCVGPYFSGQQTTCSASVMGGDSPTGTILWQTDDPKGTFSANPCTLSSGSCGVMYTPSISASITASYSGDNNNKQSSTTITISVNIVETIQITVANSGPVTQVSLSGCSVSPTSIQADGIPHTFQAASGCSGIVVSLPAATAATRYLSAAGQNSLTVGSCSSNSCAAFSATIYYQLLNTYQVAPASPSSWSTAGTINVSGTGLGLAGQPVCSIVVTTGTGEFSCQGWSDFNAQVTMGALQVPQNQNERWATGQSTFTDTQGGNLHTSSYYSQVLEDFQYSLVGSTTAPTTPQLRYVAFGANSTLPLTGSESLVWLDSGSSWSVPAALSGSTPSERWEGSVTAGAATAGQTVALTYYHQFDITFSFSVVGGGAAYVAPVVQFTSFGAPVRGSQGWVDAGTSYSFTNPLSGSTASERWFTSTQSSVASAPGTASAVYYHQYAFTMNFTVSGGGGYVNPRLNFTSLGGLSIASLNTTSGTVWMDSGAKWSASLLLPNSSPTERWVTKQVTSGTAIAPVVGGLLYYHQYLGTLRYSVLGGGGSPPVPSLNYTSLADASFAHLSESAATYWMDSGSSWATPLTTPGVQGERWLSNVTAPLVASAPFVTDVQYAHQFYVEVGVSTPAGGQVANSNQWVNQQGSVNLNATAAQSWSFGYWKGATAFSYNGTTRLAMLTVLGPANETAIFFPGLTITADDQGSVAYSYGTISGTIPAGSNATIYPPLGRNVTLIAMPKTVSIKFQGWTGGVVGRQLPSSLQYDLQAWVSIESPNVVHASFATDYVDIRTFAVASIGVFIAASFVFIIRRGFAPKRKQ